MKTNFLLTITLLAFSSGCSAHYVPLVDIQMSPAAADRNFDQDLFECQGYAQTVDPGQSAAGSALAGAIFSAALGAAIGGILGDPGLGAALGATDGAIEGAAYGLAAADARQREIINNCMNGRGWNIL